MHMKIINEKNKTNRQQKRPDNWKKVEDFQL